MQADQTIELESSLRTSPKPLALLLALPAVLLTLLAFRLANATATMILATALYGAVIVLWLLADHRPKLAIPATLGAYLSTVIAVALVTQTPAVLPLTCLVTGLAAMVGGERPAIYMALLQTLVLGLLGVAELAAWPHVAQTLILNAGVLGLSLALLRPVRTLAYWSFERYDRAQALLHEARERQAELKQALDALAHANRELSLAHDRLAALRLVAEDARRTKATFVSNVSHEFRAPLNIIIGLAEILLDARQVYGRDLPPEAVEDVRILQRNCQHLVDLINDVLDLSQIEVNQLALRREWVDLGALLTSAAEIVRPLIVAKGLALELNVPGALDQIYCDPRRIRQVLLNLASNAARFTEQGRIVIAAQREGDQLLIRVEDTGPGIKPDDIERIFEPFQQSGSTGAVLGKGSGLGLAISREFVRMHEGTIWAETELGRGSAFYVRLPLKPAAELNASAERWLTTAWSERRRVTRVPTTALGDSVVMHDATHRLGAVLGRYASDIALVHADSLEAVPMLCAQESARAVLLCDDDLAPILEGLQSLALQLPSTPVLGITLANDQTADEILGASDYIIKPVSADNLREVFGRLALRPRRFMIVDDEPDARHMLAGQLRRIYDDVEISEASSGVETLARLAQEQPDVVLMDVIMPEMDGWQTLAALRLRPELADLPVVMVSAQDRHARPLTGEMLCATIQGGMNLGKLIASFRAVSDVLLPHVGAPAATPPKSQRD